MDTELFMECEEEELEPWQQVDDDVEEDDDFIDPHDDPAPALPSETIAAPVVPPPTTSSLPPASATPTVRPAASSQVPPGVHQGQQLILTQTPSGAFLLPTATGAPSGHRFFLTTQMVSSEKDGLSLLKRPLTPAERMRKFRQKMSTEAREKKQARHRQTMARRRQEMSAEAREKEQAKDRQRKARRREEMSAEAREKEQAKDRQRKARRKQEMSAEAREKEQARHRQRMARRRQEMSAEAREEEQARDRQRKARRKQEISTEAREKEQARHLQRKARRRQEISASRAGAPDNIKFTIRPEMKTLHNCTKNMGFPVQNVRPVQNIMNPMTQLLFNLPPGQPMQPLTLIQSPQVSQLVRPQGQQAVQVRSPAPTPHQPGASYAAVQIPGTFTIRPGHPGSTQLPPAPVLTSQGPPVNFQMGGTGPLKLAGFASPLPVVLPPAPANGVTKAFPPLQAPPMKRCPRCGADFKTQTALSGHMCFCCPDVAGTVPAVESPGRGAPVTSCSAPTPGMTPGVTPGAQAATGSTKVVMTVEDFYYGSYDGSRNLRGPEAMASKSFVFKCQVCSHQAEDNLRMMHHMHQHSELGGANNAGDDNTLCRHCFRQFSTTRQLRSHQQQVHGTVSSSCMCRICEWAFESEPVFLNHMKTNHKPGEMPYVCQVCAYRSSFYIDVYNHFMTWHRDTRFLLCVFCLKVTRNSTSYQQHLLRHQKNQAFHCSKCRLQFIFLKDKIEHKTQYHKTFRKPTQLEGLLPGAKVTIRTYGKIRFGQQGPGPIPLQNTTPVYIKPPNILKETQKSPNQKRPLVPKPLKSNTKRAGGKKGTLPNKLQDKSCDFHINQMCMECGTDATDIVSHYPTHVICLLCPYSTCCSRAYAAHMIHNHVPRLKDRPLPLHMQPPPCCLKLQCSVCGFIAHTGDLMAEHLAGNTDHNVTKCQTRTYVEPDIKFCHIDEEEEGKSDDLLEPSWTLAEHWKDPSQNETGAVFAAADFTESSGPFYSLSKNTDAMDYFSLVFPSSLIELITNETNAHAKTCQYLGLVPDWTPVTTYEIKGFVGLVILMGIQNLPELSHYWSWSHNDNGSTFYRAMSFDRFKQIALNIRMGSFTTDEYRHNSNRSDTLHIFRPMLDILSSAMWEAYQPNCCLTIDRALLPSLEGDGSQVKGRPRVQPQVWLLCDSKSGYCHRFSIDMGEKARNNPGFSVVPKLVKGLEEKHHQLYLASSLTSVPLMQKLLDQGIYASSSFPLRSPILPKELWEQGHLEKPGDFLQRQFGPLLATRWKDTKEMGCLSTNAVPGQPDTVWRRSQTKVGELDPIQRPMAFRLLQENMRGVDICKQLLACNPLGGVQQDWRHWRNVFWFLVNLSIVNAFILLRESRKDNPPFWVQDGLFSQANFRKRLGNQLAKCAQRYGETKEVAIGMRKDGAEQSVKERHRMVKISPITKRCWNCKVKNIRHESLYGCIICKANLCKQPSCFWEFHGLSPLNRGSTKVGFIKDRISGAIEMDDGNTRSVPFNMDEAMAPVEEMESSEDERMETTAEQTTREQEAKHSTSHPVSTSGQMGRPAAPPVVRDREDALSARQLRISLFALCGGIRQASLDFSTEARLIQAWLKEARRHLRRAKRDQVGKADGVQRMVEWALAMREQQIPINESNLFQKATFFKKKGAFSDSFRISYDWAVSFMLQHRLGLQTAGRVVTVGRVLPHSMEDKAQRFTKFTQKQIQAHKLPNTNIAAMDELSIFVDFDLIEDASKMESRAEAFKLSGSIPPLLTIYLAGLADGTMLPTLVLLKGHPPDKVLPDSVLLEASPEGFSLESGLELWTNQIWQQYVSTQSQPGKSMLILDRHREHMSNPFLAAASASATLPAVIPPGCAFRLQPLDICVRPMLQRFLLARWAKFAAEENGSFGDQLQADVAQLLINWLAEALACLANRPELLRESFQLTGLLPGQREGEETPLSPAEVQSQLLNTLGETLLGAKALEPCPPDELELEDEEETEEEAEEGDENKGNQAADQTVEEEGKVEMEERDKEEKAEKAEGDKSEMEERDEAEMEERDEATDEGKTENAETVSNDVKMTEDSRRESSETAGHEDETINASKMEDMEREEMDVCQAVVGREEDEGIQQ